MITLDLIKEANPLFFDKVAVKWHKDKDYLLDLTVMQLTVIKKVGYGFAVYDINPETLKLCIANRPYKIELINDEEIIFLDAAYNQDHAFKLKKKLQKQYGKKSIIRIRLEDEE